MRAVARTMTRPAATTTTTTAAAAAAALIWLLSAGAVLAQAQLRAGPMLGYNTMREVAVWVQTVGPEEVRLRYWPVEAVRDIHYTASAKTSGEGAFCATLVADSLREGTTYEYQVLLGGRALPTPDPLRFTTQPLWAFRTDPPDYTLALGSCYYANEPAYDRPGKGYGGEYGIFRKIDSLRPDLMLWLGDNVYLRPGDFQSRGGVLHRHSHARAIPELQPLLRRAHHYAIWDDHDYGPNDSDRSYVHKDWTREAHDLFWANPPAALGEELAPGITTSFAYGDAQFFLLDNRTYRAPNACRTCDPMALLGDAQVDWLVDALVSSPATWKFVLVGGQVLSPAEVWENYAHHHGDERRRLLSRISQEGVRNVVFLTGDRHHTELSRTERGGVVMHDFTSSPLTSGATARNRDEGNTARVPGTFVGERNFGTITVSGAAGERSATLRTYSAGGEKLWEYVIEAAGPK